MALTSDGGGGGGTPTAFDLGSIISMLRELLVDEVTIKAITDALESGTEQVVGYEQPRVEQTRFGTLGNGALLGHHAELARQAARDAVLTMAADLEHYSDGVVTFRKGVNTADEHAREDLDRIAADLGAVRSDTDGSWER